MLKKLICLFSLFFCLTLIAEAEESLSTEVITECIVKEADSRHRFCRAQARNTKSQCRTQARLTENHCLAEANTEQEKNQCEAERTTARHICNEQRDQNMVLCEENFTRSVATCVGQNVAQDTAQPDSSKEADSLYVETIKQCLLKKTNVIHQSCVLKEKSNKRYCYDQSKAVKNFCLAKADTKLEKTQCLEEYKTTRWDCKGQRNKYLVLCEKNFIRDVATCVEQASVETGG